MFINGNEGERRMEEYNERKFGDGFNVACSINKTPAIITVDIDLSFYHLDLPHKNISMLHCYRIRRVRSEFLVPKGKEKYSMVK